MSYIEHLEQQISEASAAYYSGKPIMSDSEFDNLVERLEKENPKSEILSKREFHSKDWNYQLEKLKYNLYSIKKVKNIKDIQNWIDFVKKKANIQKENSIELILTPKYDGIKILFSEGKYYTRYEDGGRGYNVTNRILNCNLPVCSENTEGELITSKTNFKKYCQNYSSSRNFIPAIFSSEKKPNNIDKVDYITYSIYGNKTLDKEAEINICNTFNKVRVPYLKIKDNELSEDLIVEFFNNCQNEQDFEFDGVVIDINSSKIKRNLGETQKYLDSTRAYKGDILFQDKKETKIKDIIWQISRFGKLAPIAKIDAVNLNEGVVTNVSLYNAKYIEDNNIFLNQKVKVSRQGKINPKIIDFISKEGKYNLPNVCPFCGEPLVWDSVDLCCINSHCKEKLIKEYYYFFKTIGIKEFGLESVRIFVNSGFHLLDFFNEEKVYSCKEKGIGDITKEKFIASLKQIKNVGVDKEIIQEASSLFLGLGKSTLKLLNTLNVDLEFLYMDSYYNDIVKKGILLDGIGRESLNIYLKGIYDFEKFYSKIKEFIPIKDKKENDIINDKYKDIQVCFSGFRDNSLKKEIEQNGGKVLESVTSSCNLLIVKDISKNSSKIQKAKEKGIKIIKKDDFYKI